MDSTGRGKGTKMERQRIGLGKGREVEREDRVGYDQGQEGEVVGR